MTSTDRHSFELRKQRELDAIKTTHVISDFMESLYHNCLMGHLINMEVHYEHSDDGQFVWKYETGFCSACGETAKIKLGVVL